MQFDFREKFRDPCGSSYNRECSNVFELSKKGHKCPFHSVLSNKPNSYDMDMITSLKRLGFAALIAVCAMQTAHAMGAAVVTNLCTEGHQSIRVEYEIEDMGKPGVVWIGATTPSNWSSEFVNPEGRWVEYRGGVYQPWGDFRTEGLPKKITVVIPTDTFPKGWKIQMGYGLHNKAIAARLLLDPAEADVAQLKLAQREMIMSERFEPISKINTNTCETE